jgi:hypothetical protein
MVKFIMYSGVLWLVLSHLSSNQAQNASCSAGAFLSRDSFSPYSLNSGNSNLNTGKGPTSISYAAPPLGMGVVALNLSINTYTIPLGIQTWTVGATGTYFIVAAGAAGSNGLSPYLGGKGVVASSTYTFTKGQTVAIAVGTTPNVCPVFYGGGGGTFISIFKKTGLFSSAAQHTPVLIAAGGGGGGTTSNGRGAGTIISGSNCACCTATSATNGGGGGSGNTAGGNGVAGTGSGLGNSAGGGGFLGRGGDATAAGTKGGIAFVNSNGPNGGTSGDGLDATQCSGAAAGVYTAPAAGYGGGGGSFGGGGGGGGYSGGGGGPASPKCGGGGGGSYDATNQANGFVATRYTTWNTTRLGAAPSGYSAGYTSGSGFVYIVTVNCTSCPIRTFSPDDASGCTVCPQGTTSGVGATVCSAISCPQNTTLSRDSCQLNPGLYLLDGVVTACPANTFSAAGAEGCTQCPANSKSEVGASACIASAGYYLASSATRFPSSGMTAATVTISGEEFTASASSTAPFDLVNPYQAFAHETSAITNGGLWLSETVGYDTNGVYTGLYSTTVDGVAYMGEWLQLKGQVARQFGSYAIKAQEDEGFFQRAPSKIIIAGSNDDVTWALLDERTASWTSTGQIQTFNLTSSTFRQFNTFRIIIPQSGPSQFTQGYTSIAEWYLYAGTGPATCPITDCNSSVTFPQCTTTGSTVCCWAGTYWVRSATSAGCTACAAGTYGLGNSTSCTPCAAGTFAAGAGSSACTACAALTTSVAGSSSCPLVTDLVCMPCAAGTYTSSPCTWKCACCVLQGLQQEPIFVNPAPQEPMEMA